MELKYQPIYKCVHKALCINFLLEMKLHDSQSSQENTTPPNSTSLLVYC